MTDIFSNVCSIEVLSMVKSIASRHNREGRSQIDNVSDNMLRVKYPSGLATYRLSQGSGKQHKKLRSCGLHSYKELYDKAIWLASEFKAGLSPDFKVDKVKDIVIHHISDTDEPASELLYNSLKPNYITVRRSKTSFKSPENTVKFENRFIKGQLGQIFITIGGQKVNPFYDQLVHMGKFRALTSSDEGKIIIQHYNLKGFDIYGLAGWTANDTLRTVKSFAKSGIPDFPPPKPFSRPEELPSSDVSDEESILIDTNFPNLRNIYERVKSGMLTDAEKDFINFVQGSSESTLLDIIPGLKNISQTILLFLFPVEQKISPLDFILPGTTNEIKILTKIDSLKSIIAGKKWLQSLEKLGLEYWGNRLKDIEPDKLLQVLAKAPPITKFSNPVKAKQVYFKSIEELVAGLTDPATESKFLSSFKSMLSSSWEVLKSKLSALKLPKTINIVFTSARKGENTLGKDVLQEDLLRLIDESEAIESGLLRKLLDKSISWWITMSTRRPEVVRAIFEQLTDEEAVLLRKYIESDSRGGVALVEISRAFSGKTPKSIKVTGKWSGMSKTTQNGFWLRWILARLGSIITGTVLLAPWFAKESPEPGLWAVKMAIENAQKSNSVEDWKKAQSWNELNKKVFDALATDIDPLLSKIPLFGSLLEDARKSQDVQYETFKDTIESALAKLGAAPEVKETATLTINVTAQDTGQPLQAYIYINNEPQTWLIDGVKSFKKTPGPYTVPVGEPLSIEVYADGYQSFGNSYQYNEKGNYELDIELSKPIVEPMLGSIGIITEPDDVTVLVDDKLHPYTTPTVVKDLTPGEHTISLKKTGYKDKTVTLHVTPGVQTPLTEELIKSEPITTKGIITVRTEPEINAKVLISGIEAFGKTPLSETREAGSYLIEISDKDFESPAQSVQLEAGESKTVTFPVKSKEEPQPKPNAWRYTITVLDPDTGDALAFKITVNGIFTGKYTTDSINLLPNERYLLQLEKSGFETIYQEINTEPLP